MKKLLFFAAACVALVACNNKDNVLNNEPITPGQPITISATVELPSGKNAPIRQVAPNTPIPTTVGDELSFHWEAGDKVLLVSKSNPANKQFFTIDKTTISEDGKSATFSGTTFEGIDDYNVYYGYATEDIDAVQELPYLKDSIFRPFIVGEGDEEGFTLNSFMPVLKLTINCGFYTTTYLDSIIYLVGTPRYAKMNLPAIKMTYSDKETTLFFPVPKTNNSGETFSLQIYHHLIDPETSQSTTFCTTKSTGFNLSANKIITFPTITLASACFAAGTRITMADGSTKAIEDIVKGDRVRTFDHEAGQLSEEAVCYVFDNGLEATPFTLHFASGNTLSIVDKHDLLVESSRKYVVVSQTNAQSFVGQRFYNADKAQWDELTEVTYGTTTTKFYTIYSAYHINTIANGLLTCPDDIDFNLNIYEMDANLKADPVQLAADRAQYGYFTSADFPELTKDLDAFNALNRNTKIALGKGLVTWERLMQIYEDYK